MQVVVFTTSRGLCGITSNTRQVSTKYRTSAKEIADGHLHFAPARGALQFSCSSIRREGNRREHPRRNVSSDRTEEAGNLNDSLTSFNETSRRPSNQEEIMALFKRIQSSISKGGSAVLRKRNPDNSRRKPSAETVLGTLQQYPRNRRTEARTQIQEENRSSPRRSDLVEYGTAQDVKVSRPPSNFVKRSPVRQLPLNENAMEEVEENLLQIGMDEMPELQKIRKMKLNELKELAKTKGLKGYSKLKKRELLELLKGFLQSSS